MIKTQRVDKIDLLNELADEVYSHHESVDLYGVRNEDAYLSGINEGIQRAYRILKDKAYELEESHP